MHTDTSWLWPALLLTLALHATLLMPQPTPYQTQPGLVSLSPMAVSLLVRAAHRPPTADTVAPSPPQDRVITEPTPQPKPEPTPLPEPQRQPTIEPKPATVPEAMAFPVSTPMPTAVPPDARQQADRDDAEAAAPPLQGEPALTAPPVPPHYPRSAKRRGLEGEVWIEVELDAAGNQTAIRVLTSSCVTALDDSALAAVAQWQFAPLPGNPASRVQVPVRFQLNG